MAQTSQLLHNRWFGKALGGVTALIFAPPDWAATLGWVGFGVVAGHYLDRWSARMAHPSQLGDLGAWRKCRPKSTDARPTMQFTFAAMGRISKASGQVAPEHIDYAEQLMHRLGFSAQDRQRAIAWFNAGKDPSYPFAELAQHCIAEANELLLDMAAECMCRTLLIARNSDSETALTGLAVALQIPATRVEEIMVSLASLRADPPHHLEDAYATLGLTQAASFADAKQAYRRLVARLHPDRLAHTATAREVKAAEAELAKCREALEIIEATR